MGSVLLGFLLVTGCQKTPPPDPFPATTPTPEQWAASRLGQFTDRLRSLPASERAAAAEQFIQEHPTTPLIEGENLLGIYYYGNAGSVGINGDLQHAWSQPETWAAIPCGENSFFAGLYQAPPDARLDYLLTVDGKEMLDPRNPRVTPGGYASHSEIALPQFQPNPARRFRTDIPHGTLATLTLTNQNPALPPRRIKVYQPAAAAPADGFPSFYVYDGLEALEFMEYSNVLDNLIAEAKIEPLVVVFIEMLPHDMQLFPDKFPTLAAVVGNEVVPLIDTTYRTASQPSRRGVTGISVWGNLAFTTAFNRPDLFSLVAGQSTTVTEQLLATLDRLPRPRAADAPWKIYLDVGNYDLVGGALRHHSFLKSNEIFRDALQERGLEPRYQVYNDGHQWANWRERTDAILRYFFPRTPE